LLVIAILVMAGAAGYGWCYWTVAQFLESTDDAYVQADSTIVAHNLRFADGALRLELEYLVTSDWATPTPTP
jgi:hypothetical protein